MSGSVGGVRQGSFDSGRYGRAELRMTPSNVRKEKSPAPQPGEGPIEALLLHLRKQPCDYFRSPWKLRSTTKAALPSERVFPSRRTTRQLTFGLPTLRRTAIRGFEVPTRL